ncbi:putative Protein kinase domain containing protein [Blattamonas nauphoetae]|uniref:Protein kinase domain-containing protein n=1 Tax=Blattamonas nauphoetae TaxID=2049346 RepID=A0ABQ9Y2F6_9EUKA|nr:putative Protein kinase domain containing protein [Blattamonas nauphoetae]
MSGLRADSARIDKVVKRLSDAFPDIKYPKQYLKQLVEKFHEIGSDHLFHDSQYFLALETDHYVSSKDGVISSTFTTYHATHAVNSKYTQLAMKQLSLDFPSLPIPIITSVFRQHCRLYIPTGLYLNEHLDLDANPPTFDGQPFIPANRSPVNADFSGQDPHFDKDNWFLDNDSFDKYCEAFHTLHQPCSHLPLLPNSIEDTVDKSFQIDTVDLGVNEHFTCTECEKQVKLSDSIQCSKAHTLCLDCLRKKANESIIREQTTVKCGCKAPKERETCSAMLDETMLRMPILLSLLLSFLAPFDWCDLLVVVSLPVTFSKENIVLDDALLLDDKRVDTVSVLRGVVGHHFLPNTMINGKPCGGGSGCATAHTRLDRHNVKLLVRDMQEILTMIRAFIIPKSEVDLKIHYAGKMIPCMAAKDKERIDREVNRLRKFAHPGIVGLKELASMDNMKVIVMELGVQSLADIVKDSTSRGVLVAREVVYRVMVDVSSALNLMHNHPSGATAHGDVKMENILLFGGGHFKLCDLGAAESEDVSSTRSVMSQLYVSPERMESETGKATCSSDVWALGIVLHRLLFGEPPFKSQNAARLFREIGSFRVSEIGSDCGGEERALLMRMLDPNPETRATSCQLCSFGVFRCLVNTPSALWRLKDADDKEHHSENEKLKNELHSKEEKWKKELEIEKNARKLDQEKIVRLERELAESRSNQTQPPLQPAPHSSGVRSNGPLASSAAKQATVIRSQIGAAAIELFDQDDWTVSGTIFSKKRISNVSLVSFVFVWSHCVSHCLFFPSVLEQ